VHIYLCNARVSAHPYIRELLLPLGGIAELKILFRNDTSQVLLWRFWSQPHGWRGLGAIVLWKFLDFRVIVPLRGMHGDLNFPARSHARPGAHPARPLGVTWKAAEAFCRRCTTTPSMHCGQS
jgi:hypothetical protein